MDLLKHFPKIVFLFITFLVISAGNLETILSCSTQRALKESVYLKHILGIFTSFMFIMLNSGGWALFYDRKDDGIKSDWTDGNAIDSLIWATILYFIFILSSKMRVQYNLTIYLILAIVYIINTQRRFYKKRDLITKKQNQITIYITRTIVWIGGGIFLFGFLSYFLDKRAQYKSKFSFERFILGKPNCDNK